MPSPFPGMDPYLENATAWSDFHNDLAGEIRAQLNRHIQPAYVARTVPYVAYETVEIAQVRRSAPDVGVYQTQSPTRRIAEATATLTPTPVTSRVAMEWPLRLARVEIRKVDSFEIVTALEILSPSNKRRKHNERTKYLGKRRAWLNSPVHFIELDLLRGGERSPLEVPVPPAAYYVTLSRESQRPHVEVWHLQLWDTLPVLPVPLLAPDPDVPLDLGAMVASVYERGGYTTLIDYRQPPPPPKFSETEAAWVEERLRAMGKRA